MHAFRMFIRLGAAISVVVWLGSCALMYDAPDLDAASRFYQGATFGFFAMMIFVPIMGMLDRDAKRQRDKRLDTMLADHEASKRKG